MANIKSPTNSGTKLEKPKDYSKPGVFKPGPDDRRHLSGRPAGAVDPVKEIGRKIAEQRIKIGLPVKIRKRLGLDADEMTILEGIMMELATSNNPAKLQMFLERTYGKVANVNVNQNSSFDFMKHADKFTDAELEAIKDGADPLDILFSKLPSVNEEEE